MDVVLLLLKGDNPPQGNLLLFHLLGAHIRFTDIDLLDIGEANVQMEDLAEQLRNEGRRPLELRYGPLPLVGTAGYVLLFCEILQQLDDVSTGTCHIFLGSGSGLTQAGLVLGNNLMGAACEVHGVMLDQRFQQQEHEHGVLTAANAAATLFETGLEFGPSDIVCVAGYSDDSVATKEHAAALSANIP